MTAPFWLWVPEFARIGEEIRAGTYVHGWEYFDADTGDGCGGDNFTWTAAVALYWLSS